MSEEYTGYQVHGSQLRYAKSVLDANGIPISAINRQGDTYIIVIPAMYGGVNHQELPQPQRSRKPWWMPNKKGLITLAMIAVVVAGAWMVFSGGIKITGVDVPKIDLPKLDNPLRGVTTSIDQTAASVNHAADAAKNAAVTFAYAVGSVIALVALWAFRGPLAMAGRGVVSMTKAAASAVKGLKHG